ncbi:MAG: ATP-binding protein [Vicinamibacterales bacterium]
MTTSRHEGAIARRLTRMNMLVTGAALLLACAVLMLYDFWAFRATIVRNLDIQAQIVAGNSQSALAFDDPVTAEETLRALSASPRIEGAVVYRPDGEPFATYVRDSAVQPPGLPEGLGFESRQVIDGLLVHLVHPFSLDGTPIGVVYIRADLSDLLNRLTRYGLIVAGVLLFAMGAAFFVSYALRRSISEPIVSLVETVSRVTVDRDYSVRAVVTGEGELATLTAAFNDMLNQIQLRDRSLQESRDLLEQRVRERTAELNASNKELEAFCYSVSHDLRAPLRSIDGFSLALVDDHGDSLNDEGRGYLSRIRAATQRMGTLIDDLLNLSRITRSDFRTQQVNLTQLARTITSELIAAEPDRQVEVVIADDLQANGDARLLRQVLENLIRNAWKFSSKRSAARIEFGRRTVNGSPAFFVSDNGAGFDMAYASRLFGVFQRLHGMSEFPGTGVGLAIVDRVIRRHGGHVWAEAAVDRGATFYFTLDMAAAETTSPRAAVTPVPEGIHASPALR